MTAIACRGITRRYANGTEALGPIDLEIDEGEFVSLLGPSGCGKSTLLRIVAGLDAPSTGSVTVNARAGSSARGIGFVFQEPTLMPWASVRDNVRLPLRLARDENAASLARIDDLLARVGLTEFADAFPRELSGGMKMRVSLARALVTDPDILLLDEPFAALDEITRFRLNNDLLTLWRDLRKTVVFVTHSVFESVFLSQRVIVLTARPGQIFAERRIDAPEPRDESFRTSVPYAGFCREASALLGQASVSTSGTLISDI
jgi:NitT/TauT family transport system ATP-binding protein